MAGALPEIETDREVRAFTNAADTPASARRRLPTLGQAFAHGGPTLAVAVGFALAPVETFHTVSLVVHVAFLVAINAKAVLILFSPKSPMVQTEANDDLPRYTVIVALRGEADVVEQLTQRLSRIDYPCDRLEGFLLLEADDPATLAAAHSCVLPDWLSIVVVPPGQPRTKPRALNHGLTLATGTLLTVYDAEDDPHPQQLREAAARFATDRAMALGCVQAPLHVRLAAQSGSPFLDRQFAAEYAALFHVTLPGLCALGLPYPLGGTSNHFRIKALQDVGGWDAWNVTEDADLGFRLWRYGWRQGVIRRQTLESPPGSLEHWLPQRTRWLKGYMQTWGVHTRSLHRLGWRGTAALVLTIGLPIISAAIHALAMAWVVTAVALGVASGSTPMIPALALAVLSFGIATAWAGCIIGCQRAGTPYTLWDMVRAPLYWSLITLAFGHAAWRLLSAPYAWDKTRHVPDPPAIDSMSCETEVAFAPAAGRQAA